MQIYNQNNEQQKKLFDVLKKLLLKAGHKEGWVFKDESGNIYRETYKIANVEQTDISLNSDGTISIYYNGLNSFEFSDFLVLTLNARFLEPTAILAALYHFGVIDLACEIDIETNEVKKLINEKISML